jgi:hypothetical protein
MVRGWVRIWRKIFDNEIFHDSNALKLFIWLMVKVDRTTGEKKTARSWTSEDLRMNRSTFYKTLKRLEKKYKVVTTSVTTKYTIISLINWHKYQSGNNFGNIKVTSKEHQSNTLQEYKNIRIKNTTNVESKLSKEFGDSQINEGMTLLKTLYPNAAKLNLNRFALHRLIKKHGADSVYDKIKYAHTVVKEQYSPKIYNYIDLESKWDKLEAYYDSSQDINEPGSTWSNPIKIR